MGEVGGGVRQLRQTISFALVVATVAAIQAPGVCSAKTSEQKDVDDSAPFVAVMFIGLATIPLLQLAWSR